MVIDARDLFRTIPSQARRLSSTEVATMKAALLFTGSGPIVILTSYSALQDAQLLAKLRSKGIEKCVAYEIPMDLAKQRYAGHFDMVMRDLSQTDDLRVLDFSGERAFRLFKFSELGPPIVEEP